MFTMNSARISRPGHTPVRASVYGSSMLPLTLLMLTLGSLLLPRGATAG